MRDRKPSRHRFIQNRDQALQFLFGALVTGADEALTRSSEQRLRTAAAEVWGAISDERREGFQ